MRIVISSTRGAFFDNIPLGDIARTIAILPALCASRARVIWTRHRREPDRTGAIRAMFREQGFFEVDFSAPKEFVYCVGTNEIARAPDPFTPDVVMFSFSGDGAGLA
ncbi:MAG: hypothetical protein WCA31_07465 [Acidimicrobiales bacterium]